MEEANVPVIKGYHGDQQDDETLLIESRKIGFPVMLKAIMGGGGKGMRICMHEDEFQGLRFQTYISCNVSICILIILLHS